jgi:hypothetical protein
MKGKQMTDFRKLVTLEKYRFPPTPGATVRRHIENLAYDEGTRDALRQQLKALVDQAAAQAKRSSDTGDGPLSDDYEQKLWERDCELWRALQAALHP